MDVNWVYKPTNITGMAHPVFHEKYFPRCHGIQKRQCRQWLLEVGLRDAKWTEEIPIIPVAKWNMFI